MVESRAGISEKNTIKGGRGDNLIGGGGDINFLTCNFTSKKLET